MADFKRIIPSILSSRSSVSGSSSDSLWLNSLSLVKNDAVYLWESIPLFLLGKNKLDDHG